MRKELIRTFTAQKGLFSSRLRPALPIGKLPVSDRLYVKTAAILISFMSMAGEDGTSNTVNDVLERLSVSFANRSALLLESGFEC
ncbi:MAG: hypothetical protein AAGA75_06710 [Cyanobacteria bacterium P01_E01_bin.6]